MADPDIPVLLDNNAISACHEVGCWDALVAHRQLETVREVEREAGTGYQHRRVIDPRKFREQVTIHEVTQEERLDRAAQYAELAALDDGERDLWVHALGRENGWRLCGPDIASIRFGVRAGLGDRLISLEALLDAIGLKPKRPLRAHFTSKWLAEKIEQFSLELRFEKLKPKP